MCHTSRFGHEHVPDTVFDIVSDVLKRFPESESSRVRIRLGIPLVHLDTEGVYDEFACFALRYPSIPSPSRRKYPLSSRTLQNR